MPKKITATELGRNLADYLNRVTYRGKCFVVQRGGRAVAELRPTPHGIRGTEFLARYQALPRLDVAEVDALERDIELGRSELDQLPVANPWES